MLQQEEEMNLYSFNKVSWYEGYDNKGQHFEKWVSSTASYDNKTQHFVSEFSNGFNIYENWNAFFIERRKNELAAAR